MNKPVLAVTSRVVKPLIFASSYMLSLFLILTISELIFGKAASLTESNMAYRELAKLYYTAVGNFLCNISERHDDPNGRLYELGSKMLAKASNIFCIGDKNVDFSAISSEEKSLLELKSRTELERSFLILRKSLGLMKVALLTTTLGYFFSLPLGFIILPFYSSSLGLFLIGSSLAFNSQITDVSSLGERSTYRSSQLQTEGLITRGGNDINLNLWEKIKNTCNPKRYIDEVTLINAGSRFKRSRFCQNIGLCVNATGSWLVLGTISTGLLPLMQRGGPLHILVGRIPVIGFAFKDLVSDGATQGSVLVIGLSEKIDAFMRPFFPRAEYHSKFYAKYYAIQSKYKDNSVLRNEHMIRFCDGDVLNWIKAIIGNVDCYCHGRGYSIKPMLTETFCESNAAKCSDSFSDLEQLREAIIRHCSSSIEFKNLAGGLVEESEKKALIGNVKDRFRRRAAKIKPDLGIQYVSDMFPNKDHNSLVPVVAQKASVVSDVRINFMRIKSVKVLDRAQKGISIAKKEVEMINSAGLFSRGNQLFSEILIDGTPKIQMLKKVVPEVVKENASELIQSELIQDGVSETAKKSIIHVQDGFGFGKQLASKTKISVRPRFF